MKEKRHFVAIVLLAVLTLIKTSAAELVSPLEDGYRWRVHDTLAPEGDLDFPPGLLEDCCEVFYYVTSYLANRGGGEEFFDKAEGVVFDSNREMDDHLDSLLQDYVTANLEAVDLQTSSVFFLKATRRSTDVSYPSEETPPDPSLFRAKMGHPDSLEVWIATLWIHGIDDQGKSARFGLIVTQGATGIPKYHRSLKFSKLTLAEDSQARDLFSVSSSTNQPTTPQVPPSDFARQRYWLRWFIGIGSGSLVLSAVFYLLRRRVAN